MSICVLVMYSSRLTSFSFDAGSSTRLEGNVGRVTNVQFEILRSAVINHVSHTCRSFFIAGKVNGRDHCCPHPYHAYLQSRSLRSNNHGSTASVTRRHFFYGDERPCVAIISAHKFPFEFNPLMRPLNKQGSFRINHFNYPNNELNISRLKKFIRFSNQKAFF